MSIKKYNIEIPKRDYQIISFAIKENGHNVQLQPEDLIFFTVKLEPEDTEVVMQKTLENGITFDSENVKYKIEITSEDTKDLPIDSQYGYDITIYYNGEKPRQKVVGRFKLSEKYTLNEVV